MIKKAISLVTAIGILYVYLLSQLRSGDALFLITSDSLAVNASLVVIACACVYVCFAERFKHWQTYAACLSAAVLLSTLGLVGVVYTSIDNYFAGVIKPLDYLVLLQTGIIFGISALSNQHQPIPAKLPRYNRVSFIRFKQRLAGLMPEPEVSVPTRTSSSKPHTA